MNLAYTNDKKFIQSLTEIVEANMADESFRVKELAQKSGLNQTYLSHRLNKITQKSVSRFVSEIRLNKAMEMLREGNLTAAEVGYKVGYGSATYFYKSFHAFYGFPPGDIKKMVLSGNDENIDIRDHIQTPDSSFGNSFRQKKSIHLQYIMKVISVVLITVAIAGLGFIIKFYLDKKSENQQKNKELSIAVLPFLNDSPDSINLFIINGMMTTVLDNLTKIKDLRVVSRSSVEQFRNNKSKTIPQIAKELSVNYIVEGSGEKYGDRIKLSIQLIDCTTDKHLLSKQYTGSLDDIFSLESEIAIDIASMIKAVITQEEKEMIEKQSTTDVAAMYMYNMGIELHTASAMRNDRDLDLKAESFFRKAIEIDSTFSSAYVHLGFIINSRNPDSAFFLANKALRFNPRDAFACYFLGHHFLYRKASMNEAEDSFKKAIKFKPDYPSPYRGLAMIYNHQCKFPEAIKNLLKAQELENLTIQKIYGTRFMANTLFDLGFIREGLVYANELLKFDNDSTTFFHGLVSSNLLQGEYNKANQEALKIKFIDPRLGAGSNFDLLYTSIFLRNYKTSLNFIQKYYDYLDQIGREYLDQTGRTITPYASFGYVYLKNGMEKEANWHYDQIINVNLKILEKKEPFSSARACYLLMYSWSGKGEKDKSMEFLHKMGKYKHFVLSAIDLVGLKIDPVFDIIRSEPEFQKFISEMESRFEVERKKIEKLLHEEAILIQK